MVGVHEENASAFKAGGVMIENAKPSAKAQHKRSDASGESAFDSCIDKMTTIVRAALNRLDPKRPRRLTDSQATKVAAPSNKEEGHAAVSAASVAKGVCLRHEKYPAP
jgi:hypothetical protein